MMPEEITAAQPRHDASARGRPDGEEFSGAQYGVR
jgi:hypothetical protein